MSKKYPLCAILKPAPWQVPSLKESTDPWKGGMEEPTVAGDLNVADLFWDREDTPEDSGPAILAKGMRELTRKVTRKVTRKENFELIEDSDPSPSTEIWDVDLWDDD